MSSNITQTKLLYFRDSSGSEVYYPLSDLKGIKNDFSTNYYVEFWFHSMKNDGMTKHAYEGTDDGADFVRLRFNNRDVIYGSILYFWQKVYTAKDIVFKVADAVDNGNGFFKSAAFGETYNRFLVGHSTNTDATAPDLADACVINLQPES